MGRGNSERHASGPAQKTGNLDSNLLKPQLPSLENERHPAWLPPRVLRGEALASWACPILVLSQEVSEAAVCRGSPPGVREARVGFGPSVLGRI